MGLAFEMTAVSQLRGLVWAPSETMPRLGRTAVSHSSVLGLSLEKMLEFSSTTTCIITHTQYPAGGWFRLLVVTRASFVPSANYSHDEANNFVDLFGQNFQFCFSMVKATILSISLVKTFNFVDLVSP
jgi:hypothetical protein